MKLSVMKQIHVSAVQADTLRPGQQIEVSADLGKELLDRHPQSFAEVGEEKAAPVPPNKAAPKAANKAARKSRNKAARKSPNKASGGPSVTVAGRKPKGK